MATLNLGFLASHGGSNMQAIIEACKNGKLDAEPRCVISNNSTSGALERASKEGIPRVHISGKTHPGPGGEAEAIIDTFSSHGVDTIILAGYMKILSPQVISHFKGRVLNIHPALLPKFGGKGMYGKNVHQAVLQAGETESGATIHLVDSQYDRGRILSQMKVPVLVGDTPDTLAARVLAVEHILYPNTLQKIAAGEIVI